MLAIVVLGCVGSAGAATLVSHWSFDESAGATAHDATGAFDGTLAGGATFVAGGISGNAVSLDRTTGALVSMGTGFPGFLSGDFSVVAWVKTTSTAADTIVLSKHEAFSENGYLLVVNTTGGGGTTTKGTFVASELVANSVTSATAVTDGAWHQIVGVYRSGLSQSIYVDGTPVETTSGIAAVVANSAPFIVGGTNTSGTPTAQFTGLVDEVQVYASALTDAEISYLFTHPGRAVPAVLDDLTTDWSDASNPNGPWSYREGGNLLPHIDAWQKMLGGYTGDQPGWARSQDGTDRIPFWHRSLGLESFGPDLVAGDVAVHTTDGANGIGNGNGNVVWTSPFTGAVDVAGAVWMGRDIGRSNDWFVYHGATLLTQGSIASGDAFDRQHPMALGAGSGGTAALRGIAVTAGDQIRLELAKTSTFGDYVGVLFSIGQAPTPTPTTTSTPSPTPTATAAVALGEFTLYKVKASKSAPFFKLGPVTLADPVFGTGGYDLQKPSVLGAPAHEISGGFTDPDTHLAAYTVKPAKGTPGFTPRRDVRVDNGCGAIVVTVKKPIALLVPTSKSLTQPVPPPDEAAHEVDHFLCYQVKPQKKRTDGLPAATLPKKAQREVVDQFQTRRYDLKKAVWLCNPVAKSGAPTRLAGPDKGAAVPLAPAVVRHPAEHLLCYQAALAKKLVPQQFCGPDDPAEKGTPIVPAQAKHLPRLGVHVANQLGAGRLDTKKEAMVCLPSTIP